MVNVRIMKGEVRGRTWKRKDFTRTALSWPQKLKRDTSSSPRAMIKFETIFPVDLFVSGELRFRNQWATQLLPQCSGSLPRVAMSLVASTEI